MNLGFPVLDSKLIYNEDIPPVLGGFETETKGPWLYVHGTVARDAVPWSEGIMVGFYTNDPQFQGIWTRMTQNLRFYQSKDIKALISPNFSACFSWPQILRLWNLYRSIYVAYVYQQAGIPVVPDIQGHPEDLKFTFPSIPKGQSVALQVYRRLEPEEVELKTEVIDRMFKELDPKRVWVYGRQEKAEALFPQLKDSRVRWVTPWTVLRTSYRKSLKVVNE